jgi:hypothetical protein
MFTARDRRRVTPTTTRAFATLTVVAMVLLLPMVVHAQGCPTIPASPGSPPFVLYFDDTGSAGTWGQLGFATPPQWEPMAPGVLNTGTHFIDFDSVNPYFAVSGPMNGTYNGYQYVAHIWCANNYEAHSNKVVVELRKGTCPNQGTLIATQTFYITNYMGNGAQDYIVDFGVQDITFSNESLIVKMDYSDPGNQAYDGHIYWDDTATPSALHAVEPGPIPTLSEWGLIVLMGLVVAVGALFILRRQVFVG